MTADVGRIDWADPATVAPVDLVREAICRRIETVATDEHVHRWERYAARQEGLRALYGAADGRPVLAGWHVRLTSIETEHGSTSWATVWRRWGILGLRAVDDPADGVGVSADELRIASAASALDFDRRADAVRRAFLRDDTLGRRPAAGGGETIVVESTTRQGRQGLQIESLGIEMFAGTLCHLARCVLWTMCTEDVGVDVGGDEFLRAGVGIDHAPAPDGDGAADPATSVVVTIRTE